MLQQHISFGAEPHKDLRDFKQLDLRRVRQQTGLKTFSHHVFVGPSVSRTDSGSSSGCFLD